MKFRQLIIIVYLLVILMSCIMAPVCAAENIPSAPIKNTYYPHLWYSSDVGGYLNPSYNLYQQFSPYSTSNMSIIGSVGLVSTAIYDFDTTITLSDTNINNIISHYRDSYYVSDNVIIHSVNCPDGQVNSVKVFSSFYDFYILSKGNLHYQLLVVHYVIVYIDIVVPVGSFVFANPNYDDYNRIEINLENATYAPAYNYMKNFVLTQFRINNNYNLMNLTFTFPANVITDRLVFEASFNPVCEGDLVMDYECNVYLDDYFLGEYTFKNCRGLIESQFNYNLNTNKVKYIVKPKNNVDFVIENPTQDYLLFKYTISKVIPVSSYETLGGDIYGEWQSKSCKTFDFVCHLGNGLGYLIYEFPLTSSITKLVAPIGEFFINSFRFLEGFSSIGVAYGVIFTMIMISVIMFMIFGK
ncbi:MAG: hypothetical protein ACI4MI_05960 [Christensenellales bacterium]